MISVGKWIFNSLHAVHINTAWEYLFLIPNNEKCHREGDTTKRFRDPQVPAATGATLQAETSTRASFLKNSTIHGYETGSFRFRPQGGTYCGE